MYIPFYCTYIHETTDHSIFDKIVDMSSIEVLNV